MPKNKLTNFFQEIKRRKVFRLAAMYAGFAYVTIELVTNVAEPLGLPEWMPTLIIYVLIGGLPIAVVLSWIFDITPEGIVKTGPVETVSGEVPSSKLVRRRLTTSNVIITVLIVVVGILLYPKVFKNRLSLRAMTKDLSLLNENSEEEIHRLFKERYRTKLMLFPFKNETNDSTLDWLEYGIFDAVAHDLDQFNYMRINFDWLTDKQLRAQINEAEVKGFPYFLTGSYKVIDDDYEISSFLYETKSGAIREERIFRGKDFFALVDSISKQLRIDLEIPNTILNSSPDLPFQEYATNNMDAYMYYIKAFYRLSDLDIMRIFKMSLDADSTFAMGAMFYASYTNYHQSAPALSIKYINLAWRHRERLSEYYNIRTRSLYYLIRGEKEKAIRLAEMLNDLRPYNESSLINLIILYDRNLKVEQFESAVKDLNKLCPDVFDYQMILARAYLLSGKIDKGFKIIELLLEMEPENTSVLLLKGEFLLYKNDLDAAKRTYQDAILLSPENEKKWSIIFEHIEYAKSKELSSVNMTKFTGRYVYSTRYKNFFIHNGKLFLKNDNTEGYSLYPKSDTSFVCYHFQRSDMRFVSDRRGKVFKCDAKGINEKNFTLYWKQDSLIWSAEKLLETGRNHEALMAYKKAYSENPEHFYLANFIRHLEFVQSKEYENIWPEFESVTGEYIDPPGQPSFVSVFKIYIENEQIYFEMPTLGINLKLYPVSIDQFIFPDMYRAKLEIISDNNRVIGVKFTHSNGRTELFMEKAAI